jgi:hypothetical protein
MCNVLVERLMCRRATRGVQRYGRSNAYFANLRCPGNGVKRTKAASDPVGAVGRRAIEDRLRRRSRPAHGRRGGAAVLRAALSRAGDQGDLSDLELIAASPDERVGSGLVPRFASRVLLVGATHSHAGPESGRILALRRGYWWRFAGTGGLF